MPTYLYACSKCDKQFEVEQRISDAPLTDCDCGAKGTLRRLIQPTAVLFKGAGFHVNDYPTGARSEQESPGAGCDRPDCACKPAED